VKRTTGNRKSCFACHAISGGRQFRLILLASLLMVIAFLFSANPLAAQANSGAGDQNQISRQRFACNVGFTPKECQLAATVLRKALSRYPLEALGEWKWVLVRSEDWKPILSERRADSNVPAFSYLPKRETFLDSALVAGPSIHGAELSALWHMTTEDLLDLAIRHELAHALCKDGNEITTDRAAIALKNGMPLSCRITEQTSSSKTK